MFFQKRTGTNRAYVDHEVEKELKTHIPFLQIIHSNDLQQKRDLYEKKLSVSEAEGQKFNTICLFFDQKKEAMDSKPISQFTQKELKFPLGFIPKHMTKNPIIPKSKQEMEVSDEERDEIDISDSDIVESNIPRQKPTSQFTPPPVTNQNSTSPSVTTIPQQISSPAATTIPQKTSPTTTCITCKCTGTCVKCPCVNAGKNCGSDCSCNKSKCKNKTRKHN